MSRWWLVVSEGTRAVSWLDVRRNSECSSGGHFVRLS